MNLGDRLRAATAMAQEADQREQLLKKAERDEATLVKVIRVRQFFDYAFQVFEHRLLNGKVPGSIDLGRKTFRDVASLADSHQWNIPTTHSRQWRTKGTGIWTPTNALYPLWEEFERRCAAAGLEPQWSFAHDGCGVESWYELTVAAAAV